MDFQNINEILKTDAVARLGCHPSEILYYVWPQTFSSTSGPFGGIGGQAISTFRMEALSDGRNAALYCGRRFWKIVESFDPREAVCGKYK